MTGFNFSKIRYANLILLVTSIIAGLIFSELALRLFKGRISRWGNILHEEQYFIPDRIKQGYPEIYDDKLGWVTKPNIQFAKSSQQNLVTTLDFGLRSNTGNQYAVAHNPEILAVGDSFTFGDQVDDQDTWPAQLEHLTGKTILNGGVSGYGIDQSFLRTQLLLEQFMPKTLIFSFIADDVDRCGFSQLWGLNKPYFVPENNTLQLKNSPVPERKNPKPNLDPMRSILGHSYLISILMAHLVPNYWLSGLRYSQKSAHNQSLDVGCLIIKEIQSFTASRGIELLILAQYTDQLGPREKTTVSHVLSCANNEGIQPLDLYPVLSETRNNNPAEFKSLYRWHMTPKGNHLIAEKIRDHLNLHSNTNRSAPLRALTTQSPKELIRNK